jgi:hypothetical protein
VTSGKRRPSGVLTLPRTAGNVSCNPQNFQWEQLKPPLAADSFAQVRARLELLPPSYLRPRSATENLYVVAIEKATDAVFDVARQRLLAQLVDREGEVAVLVHPFHSRGREGFDELLGETAEAWRAGEVCRGLCAAGGADAGSASGLRGAGGWGCSARGSALGGESGGISFCGRACSNGAGWGEVGCGAVSRRASRQHLRAAVKWGNAEWL